MLIIPLVVGFGVGILSGLLGIGGGTLLVPVFKLGFAMESIVTTATSLFTVVITSISGTISHLRAKTCLPALGVAAGIGGAITSTFGVYLATISPEWLIMVVAAAIIVYSGVTMLRKAIAAKPAERKRANPVGEEAAADAEGQGSVTSGGEPTEGAPRVRSESADDIHLTSRQLMIGAAIGVVAGVASGYVGVGGGFLMVPMFISLLKIPMKVTSGTSLLAIVILGIPSIIYQAVLGNIDWVAGIAVGIGSIPGAIVGTKLLPRIPERKLRFLFAFILLVAAVMLVLNETGLFNG